MSKKDPKNKIAPSRQEELREKWDNMDPEERRLAAREQFKSFLRMFQGSAPVMYINGKPQEHSPMTQEEADLHLAIFDGEIEPTPEVRLQLAQLEALRWPDNKKLQAKMWKAMEEVKAQ